MFYSIDSVKEILLNGTRCQQSAQSGNYHTGWARTSDSGQLKITARAGGEPY